MHRLSFVTTFIAILTISPGGVGKTGRPSHSLAPQMNLTAQAQEEARKFWAARMVKCGDSFYWKTSSRGIRPELIQAKYFDFTVTSRPVTEADRLNGITWKGATQGRFSVYRYYKSNEGWTRWFQGQSSGIGLSSSESLMERRNGQWKISDHFTTLAGSMVAVTCAYARDPAAAQERADKQNHDVQQSAADVQMYKDAEKLGLFFSKNPAPPLEMLRSLYKMRGAGRPIHGMYFAANGGWLILSEGRAAYEGLPSSAQANLMEAQPGKITDAAFTPNGGWAIRRDDSGDHKSVWRSENIPSQLRQLMDSITSKSTYDIYGRATRFGSVGINSDDQWFLTFSVHSDSRPTEYKWAEVGIKGSLIHATLDTIMSQSREPTGVVFAPNGGWITLYGGKCFQALNVPQELANKLSELSGQAMSIQNVAIANNGAWVIHARDDFRVADSCLELAKVWEASDVSSSNPKRSSPDARNVYEIRVFNCDDRCKARFGGSVVVETGFGQDSGWIDVTDKVNALANPQLTFEAINDREGYTYGFLVRKNGQTVMDHACGTSRIIGCENNRNEPERVVRLFTYYPK
jgi:hypothetical protein